LLVPNSRICLLLKFIQLRCTSRCARMIQV
jgi:hypothetical protein